MAGPRKIKKISAADQVFEEMRQLILEEVWKIGERIPTETQLAEQFAVNRLTVRVALQRLQALGLLDIRVGDGTYVKALDMTENISELAAFYSSSTSAKDAEEYRYIIETACVRLAVYRRTDEDLASYWEKYQEMVRHANTHLRNASPAVAEKEAQAHTDMNLDIHTILCGMAHNELLNYAFSIAKGPNRNLMLRNVLRRMRSDSDISDILDLYEKLYLHLKEQDPEESLRAIRQIMHIDVSGTGL